MSRSRQPIKQIVIHLQLTQNDFGEAILYAEAATDTGQRCGVSGPYSLHAEAESISELLRNVGTVLAERVTFGQNEQEHVALTGAPRTYFPQ